MSTLKTVNIQHPSSVNNNIVLTSGGDVSVANNLITPNGNVAIKTTNPIASLDVNGAIAIANTLEPLFGYDGMGMLLYNQQVPINDTTSTKTYAGLYNTPRAAGSNTGWTYVIGSRDYPYIISSNQSGRVWVSGHEVYSYRSDANDISTFATNGIWGLYIEAGHQSTLNANASTATVYGAQLIPSNFRSNVTSMYGVQVNGYSGSVAGANTNTTNFYSLYTNLNVGAASGVGNDRVTNYYDAYLNGATVAARGTLTNKYGVYQVKADHVNYFAGRVYSGAIPSSNVQVYAGATPNTLDSYVVLTDATIGSNTTSSATAFTSNPSTVAASFTLPSLNHFLATQGTIGAGSAITNQRGFYAFNSLTGATNNYGFYSDIASGANRWNFYASGTAYNFFQGGSGFGTGPTAYSQIRMGGTAPSSSALSYSLYADQTAPSTTTSEFASFYSIPNTTAASFTLGTMFHFIALQGTIGAGSAITNQFGFYVGSNLTGATNNYGYYSNIPVGANRWNLYMNGTANNYIAGNLGIGITDPTSNLHVIGTANISSATLLVAGQNVISAIASKVDTITSNSTSRIWANSVTTSGIETVFLDLASSGVTATTYGGTGQVPAIVVDAYGRITSASNVASSGLANTSGISFNGSLYFPTGNIGIGRASATNPLDVYYTGADLQGGAFSVDVANSSLNTFHAFTLRMPATGGQKAFSIAKGVESFAFASFTNAVNGANTPGFELGSGLVARDTKLYRTGVGILNIDNTVQVNTSISIGRNATAYALDVNGSINVSSGGAISGGFTVASFNAGSNIASYGTWTPNPANGNYQYVTSNGSVTIAVPTSNCAIDVLWYNGVSPGSVTFSGYQAASGGGGDSYLTTANYEYILSIRRINGLSTYVWKALQ